MSPTQSIFKSRHSQWIAFILLCIPGSCLLAGPTALAPEMIRLPAGSFEMGSDDARRAEKPVHTVHIKSFLLGQTEVTQGQWLAVMGTNPSKFDHCLMCPVERVSWDNIQTFLLKLNRLTGKRFRLPSEAEWEYACRSGGKKQKYCGSNDRNSVSWNINNSDRQSHPVKQKQPNELGLYDMSGNVFEWTQDCWNANYEGAPDDGSAWLSGNCEERILRGGSWNSFSSPGYLRSAYRFRQKRHKQNFHVFGFRLAHDATIAE